MRATRECEVERIAFMFRQVAAVTPSTGFESDAAMARSISQRASGVLMPQSVERPTPHANIGLRAVRKRGIPPDANDLCARTMRVHGVAHTGEVTMPSPPSTPANGRVAVAKCVGCRYHFAPESEADFW